MLKVLHLINYTGGGGTEKYIYSLGEQMHNRDFVFYLAYNEEGSSLEDFHRLGFKSFQLNMTSPFDLKAAKKLALFCRENSIDLIHTHFLRENYVAILSRFFGSRVKIVNTRHMVIENSFKVRTINKFMSIFNKNIIAVSKAVEELLKKEVLNKKKISLIYTGIDLTLNDGSSNIREELKLSDELLITSVARFSPEKGHKFLIDSIYRLSKNVDLNNYRFLLVGDGPSLKESMLLVEEYKLQDIVIFTGYRKDVENILNGSDIFVCHSREEAFGISILEAMSAKLPVISTDTGGTSEIIDGSNGILVKYGNADSMASSIYSLLKDAPLRKSIGDLGYETLENKFNINKTIDKTIAIYRK